MDEQRGAIWERQEWDTDASWNAFQLYLGMDTPRSVLGAYKQYIRITRGEGEAQKIVKIPGNWYRWSNVQDSSGNIAKGSVRWVDRSRAWEDHKANDRRKAELTGFREQSTMRTRALMQLMLVGQAIVGQINVTELNERSARKLLPVAVRAIEAASRGQRGEIEFLEKLLAVESDDAKYVHMANALSAEINPENGNIKIQLGWSQLPPSMYQSTEADIEGLDSVDWEDFE